MIVAAVRLSRGLRRRRGWSSDCSWAVALGNDVDRVARRSTGGVVDFLTLPHWPAFNLADVAITVGVAGLLALVVLRRPILLARRAA